MQKYDEFLESVFDIAPGAVVTEEPDGQLVILTGLTLNRSPANDDLSDFFVHDTDLLEAG